MELPRSRSRSPGRENEEDSGSPAESARDEDDVVEPLSLADQVAAVVGDSDRAARDIRAGGPVDDADQGGGAQFDSEQAERVHDAMVERIQTLLEKVKADTDLDSALAGVLRLRLQSCLFDLEAALAAFEPAPQKLVVQRLRRALDVLNGRGGAPEEDVGEEEGEQEEAVADFDEMGEAGAEEPEDLDEEPLMKDAVVADYAESQLEEARREDSESQSESQVEDAYVVRAVLARYARLEPNGERVQLLLVDWEGYGNSARSWEPRKALKRTDALSDFEIQHGPLGDDDGLVAVRFLRTERWRIEVFTPTARTSAEREAVWLTQTQLTDAGRALVAAWTAGRGQRGQRRGGGTRPAAAGRPGDEDDDEDDAGRDDDHEPGPEPAEEAPGGALRRLLQYDNEQGAFRVSLTRTFRHGNYDPRSAALLNALHEYTVTRLWLLECALPGGEVTAERIERIAKEYFDIEQASFMRGFKAVLGGPSQRDHVESEVAFQVRRLTRRWEKLAETCNRERETLRTYLAALKRIRSEARGGGDSPPGDGDEIVGKWRRGERWWVGMELPVARSTRQNELIRKTAEVKRLIAYITERRYGWTGRRSDAQRRNDTLGSPYSGHRPTSWKETSVTQNDHTIPQSWCTGTELVNVFSSVRQDLNNIIPIPGVENAKKSNLPIEYVTVDADEDRPDSGLFDPRDLRTGGVDFWTERRQAVSARQVIYTYLSYGLISETSDQHVSLEDRGPGSGYFSRTRVRDHIVRVVAEHPAEVFEKDIDDMLLFVTRTHNPLLHSPRLLVEGEFASDYLALLAARLEGETRLPELVGQAIRGSVAGFPGA